MRKPTTRLSRAGKATGAVIAGVGLIGGSLVYAATGGSADTSTPSAEAVSTTTPIKHLVVLFGENVSYDHYFGTYPKAANTDGVPFTALPNTPANTNLLSNDAAALKDNPNSVSPFRFSYSQALTNSQGHGYSDEQKAVQGSSTSATPGMDRFPESTSHNTCSTPDYCTSGTSMGYYDGNTATGLWNYAQNYAMSDNSWDDVFGPSTNGALDVVSGQTYGAVSFAATSRGESPTPAVNPDDATLPVANNGSVSDNQLTSVVLPTYNGAAPAAAQQVSVGTDIGDPDPAYDDCSTNNGNVAGMLGQNIGDVLNTRNISWGWFQGGFAATTAWDPSTPGSHAACASTHNNIGAQPEKDYSAHHNPFAYYASTANPHHLAGTPGVTIGADDPQHRNSDGSYTGANHQYDLSVFEDAIADDTIPAVSYVKADAYQDGHPGNSDPIDEQHFYTRVINALEKSPEWKDTAVVIAYDDSDGWYDHVAPKILNGSNNGVNGAADDQLVCTVPAGATATAPKTNTDGTIENGRCGPSQRLPMLVISPYAKRNYIDHTPVGQASVVAFIEQNWGLPSVDDETVSGSWDTRDGSIQGMFDFDAKPNLTPVILRTNGTVLSGGLKPPGKPVTTPVTKPAPTTGGASHALVQAQAKLARHKAALAKAKKVLKKKHGAAKKAAHQKVKRLKRKVAADKRAVRAAS